ncbi:MAG TPA: hypothetical protein VL981_00700 [Candidatus Methylacidiphilales bacterium]|nr:hypothetical protein [Candidatus Methylacidiphilales bacterium]
MNRLFPLIAFALAFLSGTVGKADTPALPGNGFDASRYKALWTKSPFAVATDDSAQTSPDYSLVGIAEIDGISYASLIDKQNQEHFLLCSDQPDRGLTLVSIKHGQDLSDTMAVIQKKNGESITLKLETVASASPSPAPNVLPMPMPGTVNPMNPGRPGMIIRRGPPPAPFRPRIIIPPPRPFRPNTFSPPPQQQQGQQSQ